MSIRRSTRSGWDLYEVWGDGPRSSDGGLAVTMCGRYRTSWGFLCPTRVLSRDFVFVYTEEGEAFVRTDTQCFVASPGQAFLMLPGTRHSYGPTGAHWSLLWFHCQGRLSPRVARSLEQGVVWIPPAPCGAAVPGHIQQMMRSLEEKRPFYDLLAGRLAEIAILELLQAHAGNDFSLAPDGDEESRSVARRFSDFVLERLDEALTINDIAEHFHVTPRHLNRICNKHLGQSPKQFVLRLKMTEARRMLISTSFDVSEIARRIGMEDSRYFSRIFRKTTGLTPTQFRREYDEKRLPDDGPLSVIYRDPATYAGDM